MKIIRYQDAHGAVHAAVSHHQGPDETPDYRRIDGDPFRTHRATDERAQIHKLLAPVLPTSVLCIGLNYRRHADETGATISEHPVLFAKGINATQNPGDPILIPKFLASSQVDYECELAVVIGRLCKNVTPGEALDYVLGYTCANDVSARDWQMQHGGGQWCRGKFFDTFAPLGPCLVTPESIPDPQSLRIRTRLNGETMQDSNTSDMAFSVAELIAFLSGSTTLLPGTVILTGTPEGIGMAQDPPRWLQPGDVVDIEIDGIGVLSNPVADEPI